MDRAGGTQAGGSSGDQLTVDRVTDLIAELVAFGCGSWRQVETEMGLREYAAMWRHWADHPPVALMVAGHLGIKPRPKKTANQDDAIMELMAMFGGTVGTTEVVLR